VELRYNLDAMAIGPGTSVGPYEITALIGEGGMGKVWRAHHVALKRDDALKVLPEGFNNNPERLARFQREAQVLASLNHPHVAHVYGLEQADGVTALVMELVEGPTLADRIVQGPIPVDEALPIAKQIADALEAAHEQAIVHRDLKPANIKLRPDGTVKVLDFGLAKVMEPSGSMSAAQSLSPTITTPAMTQLGMILGTAAYMSPEQAKGKQADKRSDIWAFGCVLYEMLTGRRAFPGEDVSDTLAAVLRSEPDWTALSASTPPAVVRLLRRSLERDRRKRLADIADARLDLDEALIAPASTSAAPPITRISSRWPILAAAVVVGAAIVAASLLWTLWPPTSPRPIARFSITLPAGDQFTTLESTRHLVSVSPDGAYIAYAANGRLYLRARNQLAPTAITDAGLNPFFSPNGQWLGFFHDGQLKKVSINGGAAIALCQAAVPFGVSWAADDTILYGQGAGGIWRVSAAGGTPEQLVKVDSQQRAHGPQLLPDGHAILFSLSARGEEWDDGQIVVHTLDDRQTRTVVRGGADARYLPTGHLVYARRGSLFAVPFDAGRLEPTGGPVSLVDDVAQATGGASGAAQFSVSADGTLVYAPASSPSLTLTARFLWVDGMGRETPISALPRVYLAPTISPDGTRVAYQTTQGTNADIWTYEFRRGLTDRVTTEQTSDSDAVWSPDGRRIAYRSEGREGGSGIFVTASDGSSEPERLTTGRHVPSSWSRDGTRLLYSDFGTSNISNTAASDLAMVTLTGDRRTETLLATPARESNVHFSPDGRWLAYESTETGEKAIFVRRFPDVLTARWRISAGGVSPVWARDGRRLFYRSGQAIMAVTVRGATPDEWGAPELLFEGSYFFIEGPEMFDVAPDGRFLMLKVGNFDTKGATPDSITVVQNWTEELKRLVPTN
jgi:serine/threonine protein kinase